MRRNPFYPFLVLLGGMFCVTACAYTLLLLRSTHEEGRDDSSLPLMRFLDRYGAQLLLAEVGLLALATVAAIGLDHKRDLRQTPPWGPTDTAKSAPSASLASPPSESPSRSPALGESSSASLRPPRQEQPHES